VEGVVTLETIDLVQQRELAEHSRALLDRVLAPAWMRTDATLAHARRFFPDYVWSEPAASEPPRAGPLAEYVAYVLLDFAVVDSSLGEVALARALTVAGELGVRDTFTALARKELRATAAALSHLEERAPALFERAALHTELPA
jgi:hypothetical protein